MISVEKHGVRVGDYHPIPHLDTCSDAQEVRLLRSKLVGLEI